MKLKITPFPKKIGMVWYAACDPLTLESEGGAGLLS
jgi:hypothetical protein